MGITIEESSPQKPAANTSDIQSKLTNRYNCIEDGNLRAVMRMSMENKNLLTNKNALYVGTGTSVTVSDGMGNEYNIPITKALNPPNSIGDKGVYLFLSSDNELKWLPPSPPPVTSYSQVIHENDWVSSNNTSIGTYMFVISPSTHKLETADIMTQIMTRNGGNWVIVNTTITIGAEGTENEGKVTIYSNIRIEGKILLLK